MAAGNQTVPRRRADLVIREVALDEFVIKSPSRREYFNVGKQERFLIDQLDGSRTFDEFCDAFDKEFGESLSTRDVDDFLQLVRSRGLLEGDEGSKATGAAADDEDDESDFLATNKQSLLSFRVKLFDPDRLLNALEPHLRWIWTRGFLVVSAALMFLALGTVWTNRDQLASTFPDTFQWTTVAAVWLTLIAATAMHEFAHALTCKHYGGEVREVGALMLCFMPCLYCNVSDAWLVPQKSRRLLITCAGGYCDLCLWALAVFVWRVTLLDTFINYLAFVVLTVCGGRGLINFNPLLRLDGYYLLSDWLDMPNLRGRARDLWMRHLRKMLWGASPPPSPPEPRKKFRVIYGGMCWFFALGFLNFILSQLLKDAGEQFGRVGLVLTLLLLGFALRRVFKGLFASEVYKMITTRHRRTALWGLGIAAIIGLSLVIPVNHFAGGEFEVRSALHHEVHSPVAGFVRRLHVEEGAHVKAGDLLVELRSADLVSQIATKEAELRESAANLAKLQLGARPEAVLEQRHKVDRQTAWRDLGETELERAYAAFEQDMLRFEEEVRQAEAELEHARQVFTHSERLHRLGALAGEQLRNEKTRLMILESQLSQARAGRNAREVEGVQRAQAELIRREQDLADAKAALFLLEAGTRPEEIAAEQAHRERVVAELTFLREQHDRLLVRAPIAGIVATPRMHEKIGQLAPQGSLLCVIEDASTSRVEISVSEDDALGLKSGMPVSLKARSMPFETFAATVERVAPAATRLVEAKRNVLVVHCAIANNDGRLKAGMTGFGRVYRGSRSLGVALIRKVLRYVRTEFWW